MSSDGAFSSTVPVLANVRSTLSMRRLFNNALNLLALLCVLLGSTQSLAQSLVSITPQQQQFPAQQVDERVVRDFQFVIASGESLDSVEICVPSCANAANNARTEAFPIGGGSVDDPSGGARWGFQYSCSQSENFQLSCNAQVVFIPSSTGTYSAELQLHSETTEPILPVLPIFPRMDSNRTATAQLTGFLEERPERGIVQFSSAEYSVDEDSGTVTVSVERMEGADGAIRVIASTADGTAESGRDYVVTSVTLDWDNGETGLRRFAIPIIEDTGADQDSDDSESFIVLLQVQNENDLPLIGDISTATITIKNVESEPTGSIRFAQDSYTVAEDDETISVSLERVGGSRGDLNIDFFTVDGSAQAGADYRETSGGRDWADGISDSQSITVPILADNDSDEGSEDFFIELSNETRARVVITDFQPVSPGVIQFSPVNYNVSESNESVTIVATRTGGDDGQVVVRASTRDGTAQAGDDYSPTTVDLEWADNDSEDKSFTVPILSDIVGEETETFFIDVFFVGEDQSLIGANGTATVSITDVPPPLERGLVQFESATYSVDEDAGTVTVSVVRSGGSDGRVSVTASTQDGSAESGSDYEQTSEVLVWEDRQAGIRNFTVPIVEDTGDDQDSGDSEFFTISLTVGSEEDSQLLGEISSATVTIVNEEPPEPSGLIRFALERDVVAEAQTINVSLERVGGSNGELRVSYSTTGETATAGEDFTSQSGELIWRNGDTDPQSFDIPILMDTNGSEGDETLLVVLSNNSTMEITITDIPPLPTGRIQFDRDSYTVSEIDESITVTLSRVGGSRGNLEVDYLTVDGSAQAGTDYTERSGELVWSDGDAGSQSITVPVLRDDNAEEGSEDFFIVLGDESQARIVISDFQPENPGVIQFSPVSYAVSESDTTVTLTATRTGGNDGVVMVRASTRDGSAISGQDYSPVTTELVWEDNDSEDKTFSVSILADNNEETDEDFTVSLTSVGDTDGSLIGSDSLATVVIEDSTNVGQIRFVETNYSGSEEVGQVSLNVERFGGDDGPVSVEYRLESDSATAGTDFDATSGSLNWADGETGIRSIVVALQPDELEEGSEFFRVVLDNALPLGAAQLTTREAMVEIVDDPPENDGTRDIYELTIISGDDQSALPGDPLEPLELQVSLLPGLNGPIENLAINWRVVPFGSAVLENGSQTITDSAGRASNQVTVVSRGFVRIVASVVAPQTVGNIFRPGSRIAPPPIELASAEIAFTLRSGLFAAPGLDNNQAQTGQALDVTCEALDAQLDAQNSLSAEQQDLLLTCRELERRLDDGTLAAALDRLAPEEAFSLGDSVIDTTDLQITNVYSRINAIRAGRGGSLDLSGLNINVQDQRIPGAVVEAAQNHVFSGGAAGDELVSGTNLSAFVNGSFSVGEVDGDLNQRSADLSTNSVTVGIDYRLSVNTVIGTGLGVTNSETDFTPDDGGVEMSAVNLMLYGTYYQESRGYLDAVLDIGQNQFDIRRRINLPSSDDRFAFGETTANVVSLTLGAGFDKQLGAFGFGPYGRLSFINADIDGYRERADSAGEGIGSILSVEAHSVSSTTASIGAQLSRTISTRSGVFIPQVRVEAEFESVDKKDGINAVFQHDPSQTAFEIEGNARDKSYVNIGLGSSFVLANGTSGFLFYETRAQHDFVTQAWLKLGVRIEF